MMRNTMQVSLLGDSRVHTVSNGFENSPSIFFVLYFDAIGYVSSHWKHAEGESTENIRVFGGFLRARGVFLEKNDGDRGVFPVFGKTLFCVETV